MSPRLTMASTWPASARTASSAARLACTSEVTRIAIFYDGSRMPDAPTGEDRPPAGMRASALVESPAAMRALGERVGRDAVPGDRILLVGPFGAGKTTFVQGLARGLGVADPVGSPSFVLENQYRGRLILYHLDLYRLERLDPAFLEELEEHLFGDGVAVVEWPALLPGEVWEGATVLRFEQVEENQRRVEAALATPRLAAAFGETAPP